MSVTRHLLLTNVYNGKVFLKTHAVMQIQAQKHPSQSPNTHQQYKIESFRVFKDALTNYFLQVPDIPVVPGMVPQNNNSLLQWYTAASSQTLGGYKM